MPLMHSSQHHDVVQTFYSEHYGWLQAWLRRKLTCPHDAADMAQNTFLRVLHVPLAELLDIKTPRAFLTTTATRLIIDDVRRRKVEQAYLEIRAAIGCEESAISPEEHLQIVESLTLLVHMLEGLPDKPRQAFMLSRFEHLGYAEIASQLGVSVSMVKQYMAQVMAHCYRIVYGAF